MSDDKKMLKLRTVQYFYVDGIFEIAFGFICSLLAVYFYLEMHIQGWLLAILEASFVLVVISGGVIVNVLVRRFKERLTWQRAGYVSYKRYYGVQRGWRFAVGLLVGGLVVFVSTFIVLNAILKIAVLPLLSGILFGVVMVIMALRTLIRRFYILALLSAAIGVIVAFSGLENNVSLIVFYSCLVVVFITTGIVVLSNFLRKNPVQKDSYNES